MQIFATYRRGVGTALLVLACSMIGCSNGAVVVDEAEFAKKVDSEERAHRKLEEATLATQQAGQPLPQAPTANSGVDEERARAGRN